MDEVARAAVAVAGQDQVAAGAEVDQQGAGDRRHAARGQHRVVAALQRGQPGLDRPHGGIAVAPVFLALRRIPEHPLLHVLDKRCRVTEGVGRGLDDGRGDAVVHLAAHLAAVDGLG